VFFVFLDENTHMKSGDQSSVHTWRIMVAVGWLAKMVNPNPTKYLIGAGGLNRRLRGDP
jgi:hypothetical protein